MLKLVNIKKDYITKGVETVHALKGISLAFRRNEFVAILGPSGCGKTTMLNIIGGLDRYTSGDLIIEGRSTKEFKDRDWDTYRNHSVGFVFQSYNLISHQTICKNVELALTISGISKEERRNRAIKALETVGLKGMENKRPNQLSGGQMQRVAIARALVNDPEIVLADEPTGALDSKTSVQIMDLLKEVAKDRLVIMVTHNPELAYQYANRIVKMSDGLLIDDNHKYRGETKIQREKAQAKRQVNKGTKEKTSMSFFTATGLSFSNLLSKAKRTTLIAIAGSIGIIGVSSVLAVSNGVRLYIDDMQNDMMSRYPLEITETSIDYNSLMEGLSSSDKKEIASINLKDEVAVDSMIDYLMDKYKDFTKVKTNEITADLIRFIHDLPEAYISSISEDYGLDLTNNVFTSWNRGALPTDQDQFMSLNGLTQMYISELKTVEGFSEYAAFVDLFTNFMHQLPGGEEYILSQYDLVGANSHYPTNANEILLVVDDNQTLTDFVLAQLGFYTEQEFLNISRKAIEENKENPDPDKIAQYTYPDKFQIDDLLGKELRYYPHDTIWDGSNGLIERKIKGTIDFSRVSTTLGVIELDLTYNRTSDILEGNMIIQGYPMPTTFVRADTTTIDENAPEIGSWNVSLQGTDFVFTFREIFGTKAVAVTTGSSTLPVALGTYTSEDKTTSGYFYPAKADDGWDNMETIKISGILKKKKGVSFGCIDRGVYYTPELTRKFLSDAVISDIVNNNTLGLKAYIGSASEADEVFQAHVTYTYTSYRDGDENPYYDVEGKAYALNSGGNMITSLFAFSGKQSNGDLDRSYLRSLAGLATKYNTNTKQYEFKELPKSISIYPKDFSNKKLVTKYLQRWNTDEDITLSNGVTLTRAQRDDLSYTDNIEIIVNVINTLIVTITIALVSFTSLSLVVSCFMITVITYISTMERIKEIGVIRSLGGRKKDVSRLFIAECLIIGLASGLIGILVTYLLCGIVNLCIIPLNIGSIAVLPFTTALIMIGISILLNVLSGLIPSMKASNQDPVIALRSE